MKAKSPRLTQLELEIMKILWRTGPSTVQSVRESLAEEGRDLAYNTVQTMLNVLHRKRRVRRNLTGRAYAYAPVTSRLQATRQAVSDLVRRMFDGSAEDLVMSLVETRQLTRQKLAKLSEILDSRRGGSHGRR